MLKSINCTAIKKLILLQTTKIRNHAMFRKKKDTANKKDTRKKNPLKVLRILSWFSKHVNQSKSPFRKFDPKTILSLHYMDKRK